LIARSWVCFTNIRSKTVEELINIAFENSGIQDLTTYEEFDKKGYFVIQTDPEWKNKPAGLLKFYKDPENNRLKTPSGKIEFYSQNLAKYFPDDKERPPVPHWIEKGESHDERLSSDRANKYPLLIMSNHGRWRVHAQCDDITWTREIQTCKVKGPDDYMYEPLWINPEDAKSRGIENGDVVKIYNERGAFWGGLRDRENDSGVVYMDHGARYDPIVPGELDRAAPSIPLLLNNLTRKTLKEWS
jgi:trimethylamine-N-oxide reductase (cytochrome c)